VEEFIHHGTPIFRRANLAMFAAGVATFGLLYCVQPLMPEFSRYYRPQRSNQFPVPVTDQRLAGARNAVRRRARRCLGPQDDHVDLLEPVGVLVLLSAIAPDWPSLLVLRSLLGLSLSGVPAVAMAYLSEEMHPDSIGLAMGLYIGGSAVGGMGGRLLVGVVADFSAGA
jgi:MFS transporter, YNFM family, putative membrane transport protein